MVINPVSYCLLNRGHWERDFQSVRRVLCSPSQRAGPVPLSLTSPSFPQPPAPLPTSCPRFTLFSLAFSTLPTFVSAVTRMGLARPGLSFSTAGSYTKKAPAQDGLRLGSRHRQPQSVHPGGFRGHWHFTNPSGCPVFFLTPS